MAIQDLLFRIGTKGAKNAQKQLGGVAKTLTRVAVGYVSIRSAVEGFKLAELAAQGQNVERAFKKMADNADVMAIKMREASAGTISNIDLMRKYNEAVMLGVPVDQFEKMMTIARGAAQATGASMEFMLSSIVTGIGRQSKLMLDNLGILVSAESANKAYAATLKIEAKDLTEVQRKQAFANEAIRKGIENIEKMGGVVASSADSFARVNAQFANMKQALGEFLIPGAEKFANWLTTAAENYQILFDLLNFEVSVKGILPSDQDIAAKFGRLETILSEVRSGALHVSTAMKELGFSSFDYMTKADALVIIEIQHRMALAELHAAMQRYKDSLKEVSEVTDITVSRTVNFAGELARLQLEMKNNTPEMIGGIKQFSDAMAQAAIYGQKMGESVVSALRSILAEMIAQQLATRILNLVVGAFAPGLAGLNIIGGAGKTSTGIGKQVINQNTFLILDDQHGAQLQSVLNRVSANA